MRLMKTASTVAIAFGLVGLTACGGGGEPETPPAAAPEVSEAAPEPEAPATEVADAGTTEEPEATAETEAPAEEPEEPAETETAPEEAAPEETEEAAAEPAAAGGQTFEVKMLNRDPDNPSQAMVFIPRVLEVNVGDTVTWVPTDLSHQVASTDGMIPEGAESWNSRINQPFSYTFEVPGVYGYQCVPHLAAGMVGLVVVDGEGKLDNLDEAKSVRQIGLASRRWPDIWEEAEAAGFLSE